MQAIFNENVQLVNKWVRSGGGSGGSGSGSSGGSDFFTFDVQIEVVERSITPSTVIAGLHLTILWVVATTTTIGNAVFIGQTTSFIIAQLCALEEASIGDFLHVVTRHTTRGKFLVLMGGCILFPECAVEVLGHKQTQPQEDSLQHS
jgi:hypothetical protein